jgi:hypothetical protein
MMMQGFRDSKGLTVTGFVVYTEDGHNVSLYDDYLYECKNGCIIPLPKGTTSDGLSYPQATWNVTPPFGKGWMAGVTHDEGYRSGLPKDFMDEVLLEILDFMGVPEHLARITYEGVEHFGQSSYNEDLAIWKAKYGY